MYVSMCVCVYVCVCVLYNGGKRERESGTEGQGRDPVVYSWQPAGQSRCVSYYN